MKRIWGTFTTTLAFVIALLLSLGTLVSPKLTWADEPGLTDEESISAMEERMRQMEEELQLLRQELDRQRAIAEEPAAEVRHLEERIARVERAPIPEKRDSMIFFRGGYAQMVDDRGNQVFTDLFGVMPELGNTPADADPIATNFNDGDDGWYVGAGIEHTLTDDVWGFSDGISVLGEIMFEWKRFDSEDDEDLGEGAIRVVPGATVNLTRLTDDTGGGDLPAGQRVAPFGGESEVQGRALDSVSGVTISMFSLTASPKIKLGPWYGIKPWIIPAGLGIHVISPPSDAGTYIAPGVHWGAGLDFAVTDSLTLGVDGRYNWVADELDGVDTDQWEAGGYLGFNF